MEKYQQLLSEFQHQNTLLAHTLSGNYGLQVTFRRKSNYFSKQLNLLNAKLNPSCKSQLAEFFWVGI